MGRRYSDREGSPDDQGTQPGKINYATQQEEDDRLYPNRPRNKHQTLPFRTLYQDLFDPLLANKSSNQPNKRRKVGLKAVDRRSPHEIRRAIIERYISRWRRDVGDDFYPAMRLILPDKDRDRSMYGLKEKVLAKYIIKILKIDKNSEDGYNLLNWKQPGQNSAAKKAGDFPGRVHEVISKRPFRTQPGDMTIDEVNLLLNDLSKASREDKQLPIIEQFYRQMNPDELKWLICIILRVMNVGATEKTFLNIWHPDADALFNISSSLKKLCWELWNSSVRINSDEDRGVALFQCFQPQLANFQPKKMNAIVARMHVTEDDPEFWIEEKLDGERMQLHMRTSTHVRNKSDTDRDPWKEFSYWSRKAKDYTYLYGCSFDDEKSALTRHLRNAFNEGVESVVLDGEMITWDPKTDKMVPFGTLKTAALDQQSNPFSDGPRPLFRIFDILYLNGTDLTRYDLKTRRDALQKVVKPVERRFEILEYTTGRTWDDIERALRKVVAEASEGLVIKNPRSRYRLNDRNDDWLKVKPEYMEEFGESLDCLVVGAYYGSGRRGGGLSSFLCGLRCDSEPGAGPSQKFLSFFKVGGGLAANDYANIKHHTEGKWIKWDAKNPPTEWVELGGGIQHQRERPDVWIKPEDSVVVQAKAASVGPSDEFAVNLTLRFPRFQKLRSDKDWTSALGLQEFYELRALAETRKEENQAKAKMQAASRKRAQTADRKRRPLQVAGYSQKSLDGAANYKEQSEPTSVFRGLTIYVMTGSTSPKKMTKVELEKLVKSQGGKIIQTADARPSDDGTPPDEVVCIASSRAVHVASLLKKGHLPVFKPAWIFDCIAQAHIDIDAGLTEMPLRPELDRHVFYSPDDRKEIYQGEVDQYGNSFARDTTIDELKACMNHMDDIKDMDFDRRLLDLVSESPGCMFQNTVLYFVRLEEESDATTQDSISKSENAEVVARFAGARISLSLDDEATTHVVVDAGFENSKELRKLRHKIAERKLLPRLVTVEWITTSWAEETRLDEERFAPL
ncbi:DNA ligase (ATP) [Lithohypha guttulata]|uniref:DNA ligase (ATP) n=1 Tax=Lithohypha guttulata TaxID=1690604 RepID=UPI002DE1BBA3|nr:DNA ligase (ATP) [Lithohypha guttulata]